MRVMKGETIIAIYLVLSIALGVASLVHRAPRIVSAGVIDLPDGYSLRLVVSK